MQISDRIIPATRDKKITDRKGPKSHTSVIIVNYRSWEKLTDCIRSFQCIERAKINLEIIVVDNCSNDGRLEAFSAAFPDVHFILNSGNHGFAHGCNTGAKAASGDYFLFINPDTLAQPGNIELLISAIADYPANSILSAHKITPGGKKERVERFFPDWLQLTGAGRALYRLINRKRLKMEFAMEKAVVFPDWVSGSVQFMRKETYYNLKGWDERYWMYYEDVDICMRARKIGGEIVLLQKISFFHNHGASSRANPGISALTKSEVYISRHVYINIHKQGLQCAAMQIFLVSKALIENAILALFSFLFFTNKKAKVRRLLLINLCHYYADAFRVKSWISPRSVCYKN